MSADGVHRALATAKVNLGLFLGPTRASDGRHELVTVMQSISLADELTLEPAPADAPTDLVECPGVPGPPQENLAAAALRSFRASTGWDAPPLRLSIVQADSVAAGLAGGSADAAAALRLARHASGVAMSSAAAPGRRAGRRLSRRRSPPGAGWRAAPARSCSSCPRPARRSACSCCPSPPSSRPLPSTPRPTGSLSLAAAGALRTAWRARRRARVRGAAALGHPSCCTTICSGPPCRSVPRSRMPYVRRARRGQRCRS